MPDDWNGVEADGMKARNGKLYKCFKFRKLLNLSVIRLGSLRSLGYEVIKLPSEYRLF